MKILPISAELPGQLVAALAERRLRESPYFFLRRLQCQFDRGILTLSGQVPYVALRQFAEAIVLRVEGVNEVVNRIDVLDPADRFSGAPTARSAG